MKIINCFKLCVLLVFCNIAYASNSGNVRKLKAYRYNDKGIAINYGGHAEFRCQQGCWHKVIKQGGATFNVGGLLSTHKIDNSPLIEAIKAKKEGEQKWNTILRNRVKQS